MLVERWWVCGWGLLECLQQLLIKQSGPERDPRDSGLSGGLVAIRPHLTAAYTPLYLRSVLGPLELAELHPKSRCTFLMLEVRQILGENRCRRIVCRKRQTVSSRAHRLSIDP
jgi:hypothetical protein